MQLSQQEMQRIIEWLQTHWVGGQHCSICGHTDWLVNDRIFHLQEYLPEFPQPPVSHPVVPVICRNCGHTVYFNAIHLGVLNQQGGRHETR